MSGPSSHDRLPWSCEAEQSVLGGLMLDNEAFAQVAGLIDARSFWNAAHCQIFDAIAQHIAANKPADILTVFQTLSDAGAADDVGGLPYLNDLAQGVASAANIWRYAEIVADKALRRRILATVERSPDIVDAAESADQALDQMQTALAGLKRTKAKGEPCRLGELLA